MNFDKALFFLISVDLIGSRSKLHSFSAPLGRSTGQQSKLAFLGRATHSKLASAEQGQPVVLAGSLNGSGWPDGQDTDDSFLLCWWRLN